MSLFIEGLTRATAHFPRLSLSEIDISFIDNFLKQKEFGIDQTIWLTDTNVWVWTTLLGAAVRKEDYELIDYILSHNADINARTYSLGDSALEMAVKHGDVKMVKKLQSLGANIYKTYSCGDTILIIAVEYEKYDIVKYLIEQGMDVNVLNEYKNEGPLHRAVSIENEKMIELLLDNNAEIDIDQNEGCTPLYFAIKKNGMNIIKLLIARGADINSATNHYSDIIYDSIFFEIRNVNEYESKLPIIKFFLSLDEQATDINGHIFRGGTILHYYFLSEIISESCSLLLDAGVDVNVKDSNGEVAVDSDPKNLNKIYVINRHIVKLMSAGLSVCEENQRAVEKDFEEFGSDCLKEIEKLKNNKIGGSNITFFDVLSMSFHISAIRLKYAGLDEVIDEEKLRSEYPLYGGILFYKLSKVNRRIKYLERIEYHIEETLCKLTLPMIFIRELWYYFTNIELNKLILYKNYNDECL